MGKTIMILASFGTNFHILLRLETVRPKRDTTDLGQNWNNLKKKNVKNVPYKQL